MPSLNNAWLMKQRALRDRRANNSAPMPTPAVSPILEAAQTDEQSPARINLNTATLAEIIALPHLGEVSAGRIESNRPYVDLAELKAKSGVTLSKTQWQELSELVEF